MFELSRHHKARPDDDAEAQARALVARYQKQFGDELETDQYPETRNLPQGLERRHYALSEIRAEDSGGKRILRGYGAKWNTLSADLGGFREMLSPGCFARCLARPSRDLLFLYNHNSSDVLARESAGTLEVEEDAIGLRFKAQLAATTLASDVWENVKAGNLAGCSFAMIVGSGGDTWSECEADPDSIDCDDDDDRSRRVPLRVVKSAAVLEISVVGQPAYGQTSVSAATRALFPAGIPESFPVELRSRLAAIASGQMSTEDQELRLRKRLAAIPGPRRDSERDGRAYSRAFRNWVRYDLYPGAPEPAPAGSKEDVIREPGVTQADREVLLGAKEARDNALRKLGTAGQVELRDMGVVANGILQSAYPGSQTGFFCPTDFQKKIELAMRSFACMLDISTPFPTATGSVLGFPTSNDTGTIGEQVDENEQVTSQDPPTDQILFRSYKYSSLLVKVSLELLQDSEVDLDSYFATIFGWRIGRILNWKFTNGVGGTAEPQGILGAVTSTVAAIGAAQNSGADQGANSIGTTDLANLELALDPAYRGPGCAWMMSPSTLASLRAQLDKEGRVLFPELHAGGTDRLLNYPVKLNVNMPSLQSQASSPPVTVTSILFGQFSKYIWRKAGPMMMFRLRQKYADYGQRAFLLMCRADGQLLDAGSHPVVGLTNSF